jgi:hexosaminidase
MSTKCLVVCSLLTGIVRAISVNPLPAPQSITWGDSGAVRLNTALQYTGTSNDMIWQAWQRSYGAITNLNWVPAAVEAPIPTFEPFPGATETPSTSSRVRRDWGCSQITVAVDDDAADLQYGVDESYTLNVTASAINIQAATNWGAIVSSSINLNRTT